jgi:hypothetical protein
MSNSNQNSSDGMGFLGALTIAFTILKLTGVIAWSWWYVTAPLWGPIALVLFCCLIYFLYVAYKR